MRIVHLAALLVAVLAPILSLAESDALTAPPPADAAPLPTIAPHELERGQKGYGFSVFAGHEPERFEVEVLGVMNDFTPELSYILARLSGQDLERSGVIAGMSGSPVYFDGRLAGAVSFSYLFGLDAIAGITPIAPMQRLSSARPAAPEVGGPRGELSSITPATAASAALPSRSPVDFITLVKRDFAPDLLERQLEILRPRLAEGAHPALTWSTVGFGEKSSSLLGGVLGQLTPGGRTPFGSQVAAAVGGTGGADPGFDAELLPGSSVAMVLVDGDLSLAGHGTVTERRGEEILALGHPMFGLGPVELPMASSEVVTVIASRSSSFKLANSGPLIGTFSQDREAGVYGKIGPAPRMVPVDVRLRGLAQRDYRMKVLAMPLLSPSLVAVSALGALDAGSYSVGYQGLDLRARFRLAGHQDLEIRQSFSGPQAGGESLVYLLGYASYLALNDMAAVEIEGVEVEFTQHARPRLATILAAHADRTRVRPGEKVDVYLELQTWRGGIERRKLEVEIPADAPEGRLILFAGDGTTMDGLRLTVEQRTPRSFPQMLDYLNSLSSRDELTVFGLLPRPGLSMAGEVLPQLPGSVRSIFAAGPALGVPLGLAIAFEKNELGERPYEGFARIDLEIER